MHFQSDFKRPQVTNGKNGVKIGRIVADVLSKALGPAKKAVILKDKVRNERSYLSKNFVTLCV
jgi:PBP1b-binding outer membrane lipoprotein LpoB